MDKADELLRMIEVQDPEIILAEENLVERLNFLASHDLITVTEDRILITEKGNEAVRDGVEQVIGQEIPPAEKACPDVEKNRIDKKESRLILKKLKSLFRSKNKK